MDHGVGCGEVEAHPTGLETDQENRHLAGLEAPHRLGPIRGIAGEFEIGDATCVECFGDQREHPGELRKHQDSPPFVHHLGQDVHEQIELGAFLHARARSPGSRRGSQHTWRNLSSASRITIWLRANPRAATSSRTRWSMLARTVS